MMVIENELVNVGTTSRSSLINMEIGGSKLSQQQLKMMVKEKKKSSAAAPFDKKLRPSDPDFTPYHMIAEEDIFLPLGRKPHNRDELRPSEDDMDLGPPIVDNDDICRQRFAIKDYLSTLRETIKMHDVTSV